MAASGLLCYVGSHLHDVIDLNASVQSGKRMQSLYVAYHCLGIFGNAFVCCQTEIAITEGDGWQLG